MGRPVVAACVLFAACGTSLPAGPAEKSHQAIVGGTAAPADVQVFQLKIVPDGTGTPVTCSAALIGARTLLTAAHCLDPKRFNATTLEVSASNAPDVSTTADWVKVGETRLHPQWTAALSLEHDVAVALLETSPGLTPMAWNTAPLNGLGGKPLRVVGYGSVGAAAGGIGVRRQVDLTFRMIDAEHIKLGDEMDKGICNGDSGGPSLHTFPDGVERIVGVHSSAAASCVDGTDQRVDVNGAFIRGFLLEKEAAQCWDDSRCVSNGCATVDLDCVCAPDGLCTDKCPDVRRDPDCPAECAADGVCANRPCPRPDPDCGNFSGSCLKPQDCLGGRCVTDAQHPQPYCSTDCTGDADCPAAMECDGSKTCRYRPVAMLRAGALCTPGQTLCEGAALCVPEGSAMRCMAMCARDADCAAPALCAADGFCRTPVVLAKAAFEGPAAPSCSAAPGGLFGLWVLLALRRKKQ